MDPRTSSTGAATGTASPPGVTIQMAICDRCATENPNGFRFCGACGAPLRETTHDARKVITALFCDVAGSTALGDELDPEALHRVLSRYFEAIRATIERHGGTVQKYAGDAVLAVFGIPRVHEDDALRAVRAAEEIGERLPRVAEEAGVLLRFRTGLNTGLVLTDEGRTLAMGDAINVAARLEQAARPGEILLGAETLRMVRDAVEVEPLEPLALKGKSRPVPAFRLLRVDPVAPGLARRLDVDLVDRERELRLLREVWDRTVKESACHLFMLLGAAGVGKSRLVEELLGQVGGAATVLRGRCLHYGDGITFWPIVEALTPLSEGAQPILDHLSSGRAATPGELFLEVRRHLESLSMRRPVILNVDDLHWAEPMLLELLDHVVAFSHGAPILLLCAARPELLEEHPGWSETTRINSTSIRLEPLSTADCEQLLEQLGDELSRQARARVIRASEGNPLFIQEMAGLAREGGGADIPPTIQALLAERLERLPADERELLEHGAIEGQVFHRSALCALGTGAWTTNVDAQLVSLVRKDLIRPDAGNLPGHEAFRFRHLLIRDAAYERMPKATRAHLHQRYAHWLEDTAVDFGELDEIAGWHLEQTIRHARELRRETDSALTRGAARHLVAAGRRAADRSDAAAARNLLERALSLAPEGDALQNQVRVALAERLIEAGDLGRADELLSLAEQDQDEFGPAALSRLEWLVYSRPEEATQTIESILPRMLEALARSRDHRRLARAHWLAFWVQWAASRATLAAEQVRLAAEHARQAGDIGFWSRALGWYVATLMYGPWSATAIAGELDAIEREQPGPYLAACIALGRAEVERLEGRFDDAERLTQRALDGFQALGMRTMAATCDQSSASIQLSKGDASAAVALLLRSETILAEFGERPMRSTTQAMLARAHEMLGSLDDARAAVDLAEQLSALRDVANFAITHGVRARVALAQGDPEAAEQWARSALDHALKTDFVGFQAEARLELARVMWARSRDEEAALEALAALELFEAKGYRPGRQAANTLLAKLDAARAQK
jgi:class 3 adenylate cyclase/tetratricopeptide (TPR) repeat protein